MRRTKDTEHIRLERNGLSRDNCNLPSVGSFRFLEYFQIVNPLLFDILSLSWQKAKRLLSCLSNCFINIFLFQWAPLDFVCVQISSLFTKICFLITGRGRLCMGFFFWLHLSPQDNSNTCCLHVLFARWVIFTSVRILTIIVEQEKWH